MIEFVIIIIILIVLTDNLLGLLRCFLNFLIMFLPAVFINQLVCPFAIAVVCKLHECRDASQFHQDVGVLWQLCVCTYSGAS